MRNMHVPAAFRGATLETLPCPGDALADAMKNRGLTPEQLADKIGYPLPELRAILAGTRHISVDLAERIAEAIQPGSADFWIHLQAGWEEALLCLNNGAEAAQSGSEASTEIGALLRVARGTEPLSAVAERCGVHKGYLSRVERGEQHPKTILLQAIAKSYGVPERTLLRMAEGSVRRDDPAGRLAEIVDGLDRSDQLTALRMIEAMFRPEGGEETACWTQCSSWLWTRARDIISFLPAPAAAR